jgi:hypothetical protein
MRHPLRTVALLAFELAPVALEPAPEIAARRGRIPT